MTDYHQNRFDVSNAVDLNQILEEAKAENTEDRGRYAYMVAWIRMEWKFKEAMLHYSSAMRELKSKTEELDRLEWAVEKVLDESQIKLGDRETISEYLYSGAEVIRDLRERGWDDAKIRKHKVTELEVEHNRHLTATDFCLNCDDTEDVLEEGRDFCSYCEEELVEVPA